MAKSKTKLTADQKAGLKDARSDGRITSKEVKSLRKLGIPDTVIDNDKQGRVYVSDKAKAKLAPKPVKPLSRDTNISFDGKPWAYRDPNNINGSNSNVSSWTGRGNSPENRNAYDGFSGLYKYSQGQVEAAARAERIQNINSRDEVERILNRLETGIGSGYSGSSSSKKDKGPAPRDTGEYDDILAAQAEDQAAGQDAADGFAGNDGTDGQGGLAPEVQALIDGLQLQVGDLTTNLADRETYWSGQFDTLQTNSNNAISQMQTLMLSQQQSAANTQTLLQNQLASTQTALTEQQRMTQNLSNAYVPAAEQTAQSVSYGDTRTVDRRQNNNSLTDLSIVSGVGSNGSLTGLQF